MTRQEQLQLIRRLAHLAVNKVSAMLRHHEQRIIDLAVSRVDEGFDLYGTASWEKTPYELDDDTVEELADAIAYQVMKIVRQQRIGSTPN